MNPNGQQRVTRVVKITSSNTIFMYASHFTNFPLYVSPFVSSTN